MSLTLLDPTRRSSPEALASRTVPRALSDHRLAAPRYQPSTELVDAVNVALALGAPLLVTGEPGTGKTQVAWYLAWHFGLDFATQVFPLNVRSSTTADDLLYRFDAVGYFRSAQTGQAAKQVDFVSRGPLWQAYSSGAPSLVLIDEIDKAPRDFPNDILNVIDQHRFFVPEADTWIERPADAPPPIMIITSNSERRLPEPFLRRCVFHHIALTDELVRRAVAAHAGAWPELASHAVDAAVDRFFEMRRLNLRKPPATSELLMWLAILNGLGATTQALQDAPARALPALSVLIKDADDLASL